MVTDGIPVFSCCPLLRNKENRKQITKKPARSSSLDFSALSHSAWKSNITLLPNAPFSLWLLTSRTFPYHMLMWAELNGISCKLYKIHLPLKEAIWSCSVKTERGIKTQVNGPAWRWINLPWFYCLALFALMCSLLWLEILGPHRSGFHTPRRVLLSLKGLVGGGYSHRGRSCLSSSSIASRMDV